MQATQPTTTFLPGMHSVRRPFSGRRAPAVIALVSLVLLQLSCDVGKLQQPDPDPHQGGTGQGTTSFPREDLGTFVSMAYSNALAWSADGTEIFHFGAADTCPSLEAVDVRYLSKRVVTASVCSPSGLHVSSDGAALFYQIIDEITDANARARIYRVPSDGGTPEMLVARVLPRYLPFMADRLMTMNAGYAVSEDGLSIAYLTNGDSLYVLDTSDQTMRVFPTGYSGSGTLWAFSPDGTEIVHYQAPAGLIAVTSLQDGSTRTISGQWNVRGLRWQDGAIHFLDLSSDGRLHVRNLTTGESSTIAQFNGEAGAMAWSADGTRVASWVEGRCLSSTGDWVMSRCTAWQYTLHLIDAISQENTQIAQGNFTDIRRPGQPVFSPNGSRVTYAVRSRETSSIYVDELP